MNSVLHRQTFGGSIERYSGRNLSRIIREAMCLVTIVSPDPSLAKVHAQNHQLRTSYLLERLCLSDRPYAMWFVSYVGNGSETAVFSFVISSAARPSRSPSALIVGLGGKV